MAMGLHEKHEEKYDQIVQETSKKSGVTDTQDKQKKQNFSSGTQLYIDLYYETLVELDKMRIQSARQVLHEYPNATGDIFIELHREMYKKLNKDTQEKLREIVQNPALHTSQAKAFFKELEALDKKFKADIRINQEKETCEHKKIDYYESRSLLFRQDLFALKLSYEQRQIFFIETRLDGTPIITSDPEVQKRIRNRRLAQEKRDREQKEALAQGDRSKALLEKKQEEQARRQARLERQQREMTAMARVRRERQRQEAAALRAQEENEGDSDSDYEERRLPWD